eukprot:23232_1
MEDENWGEGDSDFDEDEQGDEDWDDVDLNDDGQQLIPIQTTPQLTLAEVLKSINLPPNTNLDDIPEDVLSKLVEKMPTDIFEQLEAKYGDKIQQENEQNKKQKYRHKLPNFYNIQHIIDLINKSCKILVLTGAGISTSSNIPDFRSKNGLYQQFNQNDDIKQQTNDPSDIFDLDFFLKKGPQLFYTYGSDKLFIDKEYKPTKTHYFIKAIQNNNKLLRMATQNIDGLGLKCGIFNDKINHCHGTTCSYSCVNCNFTIKTVSNFIQFNLQNKSIPYCIQCRQTDECKFTLDENDIISKGFKICKEEKDEFTNVLHIRIPCLLTGELKRNTNILRSYPLSLQYSITQDLKHEMFDILELRHDDDDVLYELRTQIMNWLKSFNSYGVFKPNTIFFSESLKKESLNMIAYDVKHCDLVIVIGTSMLVDPFGSIPNLLHKNIPLILINRQVVGLSQYEFDINILGDCDDICEHILYQMKWNYDYNDIINKYEYKFIAPNYCLFKNGKLPQISAKNISKQTMIIKTDMSLDSIQEEKHENEIENSDRKWEIGDKIEYKYKNENNNLTEWCYGCGVILELYILNDMDMVKIKLSYGVIKFELNKIEITKVMNELPERFFVYGTLRDDDNSNTVWTNNFVKDCIAQNAKLYGFKLFKFTHCNYPFVMKTNDQNDYVCGRLLYWHENNKIFNKKLKEADQIEGYEENNNQNNFYEREVVEVVTDDKQIFKAIVYYRTDVKVEKAIEIPYNDWLKRNC